MTHPGLTASNSTTLPACRTPLYDLHVENKGLFSSLWQGCLQVPAYFESILAEHRSILDNMALVDLGYRGAIRFNEPAAAKSLNKIASCDISELPIGSFREVPLVYPDGTFVDLATIAHESEGSWTVIFSHPASEKAIGWVLEQAASPATTTDLSFQSAWMALLGPAAEAFLGKRIPSLPTLQDGQFGEFLLAGVATTVWRRSKECYEISCQPELLVKVAHSFLAETPPPRLCGWAGYENWRLEEGLLRFGHEIKSGTTPLDLGLDTLVEPSRPEFVAQASLTEQQKNGLRHMLIHFSLEVMRLPRRGAALYCGERLVGRVIAGGFSPALNRPIGSALATVDGVDFDTLTVEIRSQHFALTVRSTPLRP